MVSILVYYKFAAVVNMPLVVVFFFLATAWVAFTVAASFGSSTVWDTVAGFFYGCVYGLFVGSYRYLVFTPVVAGGCAYAVTVGAYYFAFVDFFFDYFPGACAGGYCSCHIKLFVYSG
jgi:hypothetical protein